MEKKIIELYEKIVAAEKKTVLPQGYVAWKLELARLVAQYSGAIVTAHDDDIINETYAEIKRNSLDAENPA